MNCADVVCLCEIWLTPINQVPQLFGGPVLRCDRRHATNNKGGVLIIIDHHLKPLGIHQFTSSGVECLVTSISCGQSINV